MNRLRWDEAVTCASRLQPVDIFRRKDSALEVGIGREDDRTPGASAEKSILSRSNVGGCYEERRHRMRSEHGFGDARMGWLAEQGV